MRWHSGETGSSVSAYVSLSLPTARTPPRGCADTGGATIAPGLLEHDRWSREEWALFWAPPTPEQRYDLLAEYDRPIYVFMADETVLPTIVEDPRFERVSRTIWRDVSGG